MNYAGITEVLQLAPLFLPLLERLSPFYLSSTTLLFCPLLLALNTFFHIVQFSRCRPLSLSGQISVLNLHRALKSVLNGGGNRTRTGDPLLAKQVLYQLSYTPASGVPSSAKASFAFLLSPKKESGGPKWTRTTDLTIISRAL